LDPFGLHLPNLRFDLRLAEVRALFLGAARSFRENF
jgi:hypothetical protein